MTSQRIGALARATLSVVLLALPLAGCWWSEKVLIRITSVDPSQVQGGHPGRCDINGVVVNHSDNKIENIAFALGGVHLDTGMVRAGDTTQEIQLANIDLSQSGDASCSDIARKIFADTATPALDCTMTGVPEGQCQKLTGVLVAMTEGDVKKVRDLEQADVFLDQKAARLQREPLPQALAELEKGDADITADFVIRMDAASWAVNRYDEGSAHVTNKTAAAGATVLHAEYEYIGGQEGWVNITLYDDASKIPCVEFWDFSGSCRDLHIPDTMKPAVGSGKGSNPGGMDFQGAAGARPVRPPRGPPSRPVINPNNIGGPQYRPGGPRP